LAKSASRSQRLAVGLMSGTSMDGVDAALIRLGGPPEKPAVRLLAFTSLPYSKKVRGRILRVATGKGVGAGEVSQLNFLLGELFAEAALKACRRGGISPQRLSVIGSHGQTIYHQGTPSSEDGRQVASTLQIAEPTVIAARTGATVVADFRTADMAAGGQGAPLVPMLDFLLLNDSSQGTVALNIGGIANVTVIPARAKAPPRPGVRHRTGQHGHRRAGSILHRRQENLRRRRARSRCRKGHRARSGRRAELSVFPANASQECRARTVRRAVREALLSGAAGLAI
jgi:1,6-anhydro-N-acetylmuramate kinase